MWSAGTGSLGRSRGVRQAGSEVSDTRKGKKLLL